MKSLTTVCIAKLIPVNVVQTGVMNDARLCVKKAAENVFSLTSE